MKYDEKNKYNLHILLIDGGKQINRLDTLARSFAAVGGGKVAGVAKVLTVDGRAPYDSQAVTDAMALFEQLARDGSVHRECF